MEAKQTESKTLDQKDRSKFSKDALEFAFKESSLLLGGTHVTFKEVNTKSYIALTFYLSIFAYLFKQDISYENVIILIGTFLAAVVLWRNWMPTRMSFLGTEPKDLINSYYEPYRNEQLEEMLFSKLIAHENAINKNRIENDIRNKRFRYSVLLIFIFLSLAFILRFGRLVEGFPARI